MQVGKGVRVKGRVGTGVWVGVRVRIRRTGREVELEKRKKGKKIQQKDKMLNLFDSK